MGDVIRFEDPATGDEIQIPAKYEVCDNCQGRGTTVDPAIDGNGLSGEEFAEDPDFAEDYFGGHYDVQCRECKGNRVKLHADWDKMTPEQRDAYEEYCKWRRSDRLERDAERRMGA